MSTKKPMVLVLAGPNGSGKSTITQYFEIVGTYTNADEIVAATGMSNEMRLDLSMKKDMHRLVKKRISLLKQCCRQNIN